MISEAQSEGHKRRIATMREKYGDDYFARNGRKGGNAKTPNTANRGFASSRELAVEAGAKGGHATIEKYGKNWINERKQAKQRKELDEHNN